MARRRILFSGTELERESMVQGGLFVGRHKWHYGQCVDITFDQVPPQLQAVNKLNPRMMQRTVRAKRAIPLPLPRSRSRDSQLQQIETNASATTAQPITIPCSGWESNKVRRCSAQVHPIHG